MELITIAITTFNKADILGDTIRSAVNQTLPVKNIMVLDNCSEDSTADVVAGFEGVQYIRHAENIGMVPNWNHCFKICRTKYLCILHDDDLLDRHWHEEWLKTIQEETDCAFYFSRAGMFNNRFRILSDGAVLNSRRYEPGQIYHDLVSARMFSFPVSGTVVYNTEVLSKEPYLFQREGDRNRYYPDIVFHERIADQYPVYYLNKRLFYSRQEYSPNRTLSLDVANNREYYLEYIKAIVPFLLQMYRTKPAPKRSISMIWYHYYFMSASMAVLYRDMTFISEFKKIKQNEKISVNLLYLPGVWIRDFFKYLKQQIMREYIQT